MRDLELRQADQTKDLDVQSYVQIIREILFLNKSVCLARNFHRLRIDEIERKREKIFIDIWPVGDDERGKR